MTDAIHTMLAPGLWAVSAVLLILGLGMLGKLRTARTGNRLAALAMGIAVVGAAVDIGSVDGKWVLGAVAAGVLVGLLLALSVAATALRSLVAAFSAFGGAAAALVALSTVWRELVEVSAGESLAQKLGSPAAVAFGATLLVGGVAAGAGLVAMFRAGNASSSGTNTEIPLQKILVAVALVAGAYQAYRALIIGAGTTAGIESLYVAGAGVAAGALIALPVGGSNLPALLSVLNAFAGLAAAAAGVAIGNSALVVAGGLAAACGIALGQIISGALNRTLTAAIFGGQPAADASSSDAASYTNVRSCDAEEAAMVLETAESVVLVPGYGLAVAHGQHAAKELGDLLKKRGCKVRYAIHPVAGRMQAHMNVLLAESDVPYDSMIEAENVNDELKNTDVVIVMGANDVVNPGALNDPKSPLFGMAIVDVQQARSVLVIKRGLGKGCEGVKNPLFEAPNTTMVFGDAKKTLQGIIGELKQL
jgi:H+-translocating NAD(P) transhydrogenase subunit beta